ncbi:hypothetical protein F5B18DRAFT_626707 [Nemania serpens]|nr:hypothetical protein F5B18DRAFT_626707 [Nemania serpens]
MSPVSFTLSSVLILIVRGEILVTTVIWYPFQRRHFPQLPISCYLAIPTKIHHFSLQIKTTYPHPRCLRTRKT